VTRRLVLFDVDGTLIERGDPAHVAAIDRGIHTVFPAAAHVSILDLDLDGKLERQLVRGVLAAAGLEPTVPEDSLATIFQTAAEFYRAAWDGRSGDHDLLPGIRPLLDRVADDPRFALGVLTGGIRPIVEIKFRRLGLADYFPIGAFGDEDVEERPDLLPLAVKRAEAHYGTPFPSNRVVIVGDTPHDVRCAHVGGATALAVATGRYPEDALRDAGSDVVLPDLTDTDRVIAALLTLTGE